MKSTEQIQAFANLVEQHQRARYIAEYGNNHPLNVDLACKVTVKPGQKYTKVDVGSSGRFMVENITGAIFGIKGYGVIHRGHSYGTLETICGWNWGDYYPVEIPESAPLTTGQNPNCNGSGPCVDSEVRILPTSKYPWGSNAILCRSCFNREIAWRIGRNRELGQDCQFTLPKWDDLKIYGE